MSSNKRSSGSKSIELRPMEISKKRKTTIESTLVLPTTSKPLWDVDEVPASAPASPALKTMKGLPFDNNQDSIPFLLAASATPPSRTKPARTVKTSSSMIGRKLVFNTKKEGSETKNKTKK